jgi:hypothetical protein
VEILPALPHFLIVCTGTTLSLLTANKTVTLFETDKLSKKKRKQTLRCRHILTAVFIFRSTVEGIAFRYSTKATKQAFRGILILVSAKKFPACVGSES